MLERAPPRSLVTTDFAIHTIGVVLAKKQPTTFASFIDDLIAAEVGIVHLPPTAYRQITEAMDALQFDFDDAFQYAAAERDDLTIVSLDSDFDRTPARPKNASAGAGGDGVAFVMQLIGR